MRSSKNRPPTVRGSRPVWLLPVVLCAGLTSCSITDKLLEPDANDPLEEMTTYLEEAGPPSQMDWGDGQEMLLTRFNKLLQEHRTLKDEFRSIQQDLQTRDSELQAARENTKRAQSEKAQSDAVNQDLRRQIQEHRAQILTLEIRKAEVQRELLLHRISSLDAAIRQTESSETAQTQQTPASPVRGGYR